MGWMMPECTGTWQVRVQRPTLPLPPAVPAVRQGHESPAPWADERSRESGRRLSAGPGFACRPQFQPPGLSLRFADTPATAPTLTMNSGDLSQTLASPRCRPPPPPTSTPSPKVKNVDWYKWNRGGRKANKGHYQASHSCGQLGLHLAGA